MSSIEDVDVIWMHYAIMLASYANACGEVSIGAVLVYDNNIVGRGWNSSISKNDPSAHAEILALRDGGKKLCNYRLLRSTLYVTLAPCMMCFGAMIHARIYRLVYGANCKCILWPIWLEILFNHPTMLNHRILLKTGILKALCEKRLNDFFKCRR